MTSSLFDSSEEGRRKKEEGRKKEVKETHEEKSGHLNTFDDISTALGNVLQHHSPSLSRLQGHIMEKGTNHKR